MWKDESHKWFMKGKGSSSEKIKRKNCYALSLSRWLQANVCIWRWEWEPLHNFHTQVVVLSFHLHSKKSHHDTMQGRLITLSSLCYTLFPFILRGRENQSSSLEWVHWKSKTLVCLFAHVLIIHTPHLNFQHSVPFANKIIYQSKGER